ncbi:hypothetical protein GIB67_000154 [Kingdonia uniflora]|uniref:Retrovirus-related Pol polyprotein from transposon TNT 1-94-like beta-barrel domain-containing protein n=1 Tax=Kingdonia uniflora TaxID=39325 RepID=A0A7J7P9P4_9MAGN|nr:hypothetical protein GIB67_000154 [Kingdonia uniflora]
MYRKETLSFEEVTSTFLSEEKRLKGSESFGENSAIVVSGKRSFNRFKKGTCWSYRQSGHYRSNCKAGKCNGASSVRGSESDTNKLTTVTSNDGDEALLVVADDGSRHDRGWVLDSGATTHVCSQKAWFDNYARMAKCNQAAVILLASAFCFLSLVGLAQSSTNNYLFVSGKVYCDTCRVAFETQLSKYIPGATVRLECRDREAGQVTYSLEGATDVTGTYKLPIEGNHEEEICEVILIKSPLTDCNEIVNGRDRARILISTNNGIADLGRYANTLGFSRKEPVAGCDEVLRAMGLVPQELMP